jgi:hypothetical protein
MKLRAKKDDREEQSQDANSARVQVHVIIGRSLGKNGCGVKSSMRGQWVSFRIPRHPTAIAD